MVPNPTPENLDEWYEAHGEELRRVVFATLLILTGNRTIAEDLAQEVIVKVWRYIEQGGSIETNVFVFARTIAYRKYIDDLRKKKTDQKRLDGARQKSVRDDGQRTPSELAEDEKMKPIVVKCMDKDQDGWLIRARLQGKTYRDIEKEHSVSRANAQRRFVLACKRVLECASTRLRDDR